jgi:hypothetical protein
MPPTEYSVQGVDSYPVPLSVSTIDPSFLKVVLIYLERFSSRIALVGLCSRCLHTSLNIRPATCATSPILSDLTGEPFFIECYISMALMG